MRRQNRLFRRAGGYEFVDELTPAARERSLTGEQDEIRKLLGLPYPPRLSPVDEETASIISAGELERLRREVEG